MYSLNAPNKNFKRLTSLSLAVVFWANAVCAVAGPGPARATKSKRDAAEQSSGAVDILQRRIDSGARTADPAGKSSGAKSEAGARVSETYGKLPLRFEVNQGQTDPSVKFMARAKGYGLFLTQTEAVMVLGGRGANAETRVGARRGRKANESVVRMRLKGSNPQPALEGLDELSGRSNYLIGNEPDKWQLGVKSFEKVRYAQVYPGVDAVYYGNDRHLEHDFVVAPGADPGLIRLEYDGAASVRVDRDGDLILKVRGGELRQSRPVAYQKIDGRRREVASRYVVKGGHEVGFAIGDYDKSHTLVIDPVLVFSSYLGGAGSDAALAVTLDSSGNVYLTGSTASTNFPTLNPRQATNRGGNDVFVTKLNPSGSAILYSTYLGGTVNSRVTGSGDDAGRGIRVDSAGNAYVVGATSSTDFPVAGTLRATYGGGTFDGFVFKLGAAGSTLTYSAYLGGSLEDQANGVAIDSAGNAYVTGYTVSTNFPTVTPFQAANAGGAFDAFVTKVNAAGTAFSYSTYLGGNSGDKGNGIAVDASGNAYVTGSTPSTNFPTANAFQSFNSGPENFGVQSTDVFVTKLNPAGTGLVYSTYLGGNIPKPDGFGANFATDIGYGIAVDSAGGAYVAGSTAATTFPVTNAYQYSNPSYSSSAFITKFTPSGSGLVYSTYLGGGSPSYAAAIAIDASGQAHVAGYTLASDFPTVNAVQPNLRTNAGGGVDPFITKLSSAGSSLVYSTYLGGFSDDRATGIALDASGSAYVAGYTSSTDFPVSGGAQPTSGGGQDAFVLKIADVPGFGISGRVQTVSGQNLAGVNVTLTGTQSSTAVTDANGVYTFANLAGGGNFTVTPSLAPYTFVPPNRTFNNLSANQTGADFTIETYTISGRVTDAAGNGVAGTTITISGSESATGVTNANGNYSFINFPQGANVTVTPSKSDILLTYSFTPPSRSYTNLSASQTADFAAATTLVSALYPVADAYVQDGTSANTNFGAATSLGVRTDTTVNSGNNRDAYLRFDLSAVASNITSAKLRVYAALSAAGSVATSAYSVSSTNWAESGTGGITWNNKPARGATALTGATATVNSTTLTAYDIDVTAYVKGEKSAGRDLVSLALHHPTATTLNTTLNSREAATNRPQLFVSTNPSNAAPAVSLTMPAVGSSFTAPANVTVGANASDADGSVAKVEFYAGTALIGTATASPYQITWGNVAAGSYQLTAVATDNLGAATRSGSVSITVGPANVAPSVSMASPADGASFAAGSNVVLGANAADADGTVSKVEFFAGATLIGTATSPASGSLYSVTWGNVSPGGYAVTAKATDNAGGSITSAAVNVNVVSQTGLSPTADAYVKDGTSAAVNFGTAVDLQAQVSATAGNNRETYLKYDLTSVSGVTQAKVRLYGRLNDTSASNVNAAIYSVATTSWTETGVTWNTKPVAGVSPLATVTVANNVAQWYEWDVTAYVKAEKAAGRNVVSFVVKGTSAAATFLTFNSKEATTNRPQLALRATQARNALLVTNSTTLGAGDAAVRTRLQNLGFTVTVLAVSKATSVTGAEADGKALVLISSTITATNVANKFRNAAVPVVTWEFDLLDDMGLTGTVSGTDFGTSSTTQTQLSIVNAAHPMAAGLSGTVAAVTTASTFNWGKPNASAVKVATLTTDATKSVIFGYDAGAAMPGLEAPARRVALFMTDTTAGSFTAGGNSLFDAAVRWAVETNTAPTINSLTPTSGPAGTSVTVRGVNFGATQGTSTLTFNGLAASPTSWGDGSVTALVPQYATTGPVVVTVGGVASNGMVFAVGQTDSDGDGLPDSWEMQYFGNLGQGAGGDPDGDGLTNLQEYQQGRNPTKSALADNGDFVNLKLHTPLGP